MISSGLLKLITLTIRLSGNTAIDNVFSNYSMKKSDLAGTNVQWYTNVQYF